MNLAVSCYRVTESFPRSERYGLVSQIRRAAVSIPANLAEGHVRSPNVYRHHVAIAIGSQAELDTLLDLSFRLGWLARLEQASLTGLLASVGQMLHALARALKTMEDG